MIFDQSTTNSLSSVKESPYDLGIEGGLMHVLEVENNYNAMMKALGLSELKYFRETGQDLLVTHEGAFEGFIAKAKAFFLSIIEKIKVIFKKFMAVLNRFIMDDEKYIKKYENDIKNVVLTDMEFKGYEKFKDKALSSFTIPDNAFNNSEKVSDYKIKTAIKLGTDTADSNAINDELEDYRGSIINAIGGNNGKYDASEFNTELRETLYGEKEAFSVTPAIRDVAIANLKDKKSLENMNKAQKKFTDNINKFIKDLETEGKKYIENNNKNNIAENNAALGRYIEYYKGKCNIGITAFSAVCSAIKDCKRQSKALCMRILLYKKKEEAATVASSEYDFFSGVQFA